MEDRYDEKLNKFFKFIRYSEKGFGTDSDVRLLLSLPKHPMTLMVRLDNRKYKLAEIRRLKSSMMMSFYKIQNFIPKDLGHRFVKEVTL